MLKIRSVKVNIAAGEVSEDTLMCSDHFLPRHTVALIWAAAVLLWIHSCHPQQRSELQTCQSHLWEVFDVPKVKKKKLIQKCAFGLRLSLCFGHGLSVPIKEIWMQQHTIALEKNSIQHRKALKHKSYLHSALTSDVCGSTKISSHHIVTINWTHFLVHDDFWNPSHVLYQK